MELEVGDIVFCTVERIAGTIVFVNIEGHGQGSIVFSEIAPGRIRNIRYYVVPKKKIICKVLRIVGNHIDLSLRRVTKKDQKDLKTLLKQEKSYKSILKTILKDKTQEIIDKITKDNLLFDFLEQAKQDSKELEKLTGKNNAEKIINILNSQKQKVVTLKKQIFLTSKKPEGLKLIKELLSVKNAEARYISAGNYSIQTQSSDLKSADNILKGIIKEIEKKAKKLEMEFSVK
jgi:translation initiation factor 2 alpha subunit (eIF-2alpha)